MNPLWNSAIGLLLVSGALLGLALPFGKLAGAEGVHPAVWAILISGGGGGVLLLALLAKGTRPAVDLHRLRYFFITAAVTYAIPNLLLFSVIPHVGAGYGGIMYTLSPVLTLLLSLLTGLSRPNRLGIIGIGVGFVGALMVAATRGEAGEPAALLWVGLGLLIPLSLAVGNIYRSHDWPAGAGPLELAAGSNVAAGLLLLLFLVVSNDVAALGDLARVPLLALAQVAAAATMFVFFFRLQTVGGPVYLSQIGYVAAAVGLFAGTLFLGERYQALTWLGAVVVVLGVVLTTLAQKRRR